MPWAHGMDVFSQYFRRLLITNASQIFPNSNRKIENPGNYGILLQEIQKITQDPQQAPKIAEVIESSEGDIFRDFDLATFAEHFKLDPFARVLLGAAFVRISKVDLAVKGKYLLLLVA